MVDPICREAFKNVQDCDIFVDSILMEKRLNSEIKSLSYRPWQQRAFRKWLKKKCYHFRIRAATGSGKTFLAKAIVYKHLSMNPNAIAIIAIPQLNIATGFCKEEFIDFGDGTPNKFIKVRPDNNFASDESKLTASKKKGIMDAIENRVYLEPENRIIVISHQALAALDSKVFSDCLLVVDESHHSLAVDDKVSNGIGKKVNYFCEHAKDKKLSMLHLTATNFRTDSGSIVQDKYENQFDSYTLHMNDHLRENCGGMSFFYKYFFHEGEYLGHNAAISKFFEEDEVIPTIIFLPQTGSKYAPTSKSKKTWVKQTLAAISGNLNPEFTRDRNGVILLKKKDKIIRVVDLLDDADQKERKRLANLASEDGDNIDIVIGMKIPAEGFNWTRARREIIVGNKNSIVQICQMIGRLLRAHKEKIATGNVVEIYQLFPFVDPKNLNSEELEYKLDDFMRSILISMVVEAIIAPPDFSYSMSKKGSNNKKKENNTVSILFEEVGDIRAMNILDKSFKEIRKISNFFANKSKEFIEEEVRSAVKKILISNGIESIADNLVDALIQINKKRTFSSSQVSRISPTINVSEIDLKTIEQQSILGWTEHYTNTTDHYLLDKIQMLCIGKKTDALRYRNLVEWYNMNNKKEPSINSSDPNEVECAKFVKSLIEKQAKARLKGEEFVIT